MRHLTDHKTNPANEELTITVRDDPGAGGANHCYHVEGMNLDSNPAWQILHNGPGKGATAIPLVFQNGPIKEVGVNGITQEVLLAIVLDRLRSFQEGDYRCRENAIALTKIEEAMMWLQSRTRARMARGVEGTHAK